MRDVRVLFFGDSYTAGAGDPGALGWVGRVAASAAAAGLPITVYGLGIRGETSLEVSARWRAEATPRILADTRVAFCVGANDVVVLDGERRVPATTTVRTLAGMLDEAAALGLRRFVVGPPCAGDPAQRERALALADGLKGACVARGVHFADVTAPLAQSRTWRRELMAGDGAHPGAAGYTELAELVLAAGWLDFVA